MEYQKNIETTLFPLLYAGPISYYAMYISKNAELDYYESFVKQSFRNRARIFGANGVITLSIPVQKHSQKSHINNVLISNIDPWQRTHWRSIESSYKSSPFFEYYAHLWEPLFKQKFESLVEFNEAVHKVVLHCLQLPIHINKTESPSPFMVNDIRTLFSIKGAIASADVFPHYQQVFSYTQPFEADLSIFDAIFNLGPETVDYLQSISRLKL